jgi:predicted homoserine dehydrogenase-like protein
VANATGLATPSDGLAFPPCGVDDLSFLLRPRAEGGLLEGKGQVEVISSVERDGRPVFRDLRWGVYAVFEAPSDYTARCFAEYGLLTDPSGRYASMYKPFHLIGLELGISVASAALRGEPTGTTRGWKGDVAAVAKRDLAVGETLDGEGGFTVWGKLLSAERSRKEGALPIGLAHGVTLTRPVAKGAVVSWDDVKVNAESQAMAVRREMESRF